LSKTGKNKFNLNR